MVQTTLELTNKAIENSARGADVTAYNAATDYVNYLASLKIPFTTDAVLDHLEELGHDMTETRFIGSVMLTASRNKLVRPTGNYRKSDRKECHMRPKQVWVGYGG